MDRRGPDWTGMAVTEWTGPERRGSEGIGAEGTGLAVTEGRGAEWSGLEGKVTEWL